MATATISAKIPYTLLRRYIQYYNNYIQYEEGEPTTVTLHENYTAYGGPEEGGWYYQAGIPLKTICVFSKRQAIKAAVKLYQEAIDYYEEEYDKYGWNNFTISYDTQYASYYPKQRPHYC